MEKKQTAIEWLIKEISKDKIGTAIITTLKNEFFLARIKEKEQIIKANRDGVDMCTDKKPFITGDEYYKQVYN